MRARFASDGDMKVGAATGKSVGGAWTGAGAAASDDAKTPLFNAISTPTTRCFESKMGSASTERASQLRAD